MSAAKDILKALGCTVRRECERATESWDMAR